jgi:hypothetical protein
MREDRDTNGNWSTYERYNWEDNSSYSPTPPKVEVKLQERLHLGRTKDIHHHPSKPK